MWYLPGAIIIANVIVAIFSCYSVQYYRHPEEGNVGRMYIRGVLGSRMLIQEGSEVLLNSCGVWRSC